MVKTCLTCKVHEKMNDGKIPKWYKEIGNDSLLPPILNKNKDFFMDNKKNFKVEEPKLSDINVSVEIDEEPKNKWLFYWASDPQDKYTLINDPRTAYNNEDNHGLVKTDKNGKVKIVLNCPQPYKVNKITYPRHVHYTIEKDSKWDEKIRTYIITCHVDYDQLKEIMNKKSHLIINALDEKHFKEFSIDNSVNLFHESLENLSKSKKTNKIKKFIKSSLSNIPELLKMVNDKQLDILDVPIVTHCQKKECNASEKLIEHLIEAGFTNVLEYPGGVEDFKEKSKKTNKSDKSE